MYDPLTRRAFLAGATLTVAAGCATSTLPPRINTARVIPGKLSPNEKLNIAGVGIGYMGKGNLSRCVEENIVALCDVDDVLAAPVQALYPTASLHRDYRAMLDARGKEIDAVVIATPDHTHAVIALAAMALGKHVYLQKPLAHTVEETRALVEAARVSGVQTQMGNQGHSSNEVRRLCEWIDDGVIGPVREVHAWSDRPVGGSVSSTFPIMARPADTPPVPDTLDWGLWLGPAPQRPYHPIYHPRTWRGFCDFGTGALGDMGCHILDPVFWALRLGLPETVQATTTHYEPEVLAETFPRAAIVRYQFPARGKLPPVQITWYDGRLKPPVSHHLDPGVEFGGNGALLIGEKGTIMHGSHGASGLTLYPEALRNAYTEPTPTIPRIEQEEAAHEKDWIRACKTGIPASSNFDYGGPLTEMVLYGVQAVRQPDVLIRL